MSSLLNFSKTYKPFNHEWAVEITKKHEEIHWTEDEADLSEDVNDWKLKLSDNEKDVIVTGKQIGRASCREIVCLYV